MITIGTKWFVGLGVVTLLVAAAYGYTTGGNRLGPVTLGFYGGVGDHFGYGILASAAILSFCWALVMTVLRDASPHAQAEFAGMETVPPVRPAGVSYWPAVAAFGAALVLIGLAAQPVLFIFGLIVLGIVVVEWGVQTWADHATGDPATNRRIRHTLMNPIEFPVAAVLGVAVLVISMSRVFLAVDELNAVWIAGGVAALILALGAFFAARPTISSNVIVGLLLVIAVAIIGVGVAAGVSGKRDFHPWNAEEEQEAHEGAAPAIEVIP
jgi:hypothetical protein